CRGCDHGMAKARYQDARAEADPVGALGSATQRHEDVGTLMRRVEYPGPLEAEPFSDGDVVRSVHQRCEDAGELHLSILFSSDVASPARRETWELAGRSRSDARTFAQGATGDGPFVGFCGSVVDAEWADLRGDACEGQVVTDTEAAADLHRTVDDAADRVTHVCLGDRRIAAGVTAGVDGPGAAQDESAARFQVDDVVGDER